MESPKHIVITGASSGLGAALAEHYARAGVWISIAGRDAGRLSGVAARCRAKGAEVTEGIFEVTDATATEAWLNTVDQRVPVDLIIANAGVSGGSSGSGPFGETPAQTRAIMAINVDGVMNTVLPMIEKMVARKRGQIAIMSSLAGLRGLPGAPAYSASKNAVRAWGEALRGYLGPKGVQVSVICPGYISTPLTDKNPFPMPLLMQPERAAQVIAEGLSRNKSRIGFPLPMYWVVVLASILPLWLTDPIFARLPGKPG